MFQLTDQKAKCTSVNPRAEKHGTENVIACDVDIVIDVGAEILDVFAKGLRDALYRKPDKKAQTAIAEAGEEVPEGPQLRFDVLGPLKLKRECVGYTARLVWGDLAGTVNVELAGLNVHKFHAEPKQGGTVTLSMQLQAHPNTAEIGELCSLIQREITVTLSPPA
jgi:hypothetical protein